MLYMYGTSSLAHIVDGQNPAPVEVGRLSHHLQGYIHPNGGCLGLLNHQQYLQQKSYGSFGGPGTSYTKISRQRGQTSGISWVNIMTFLSKKS